MTLDNQIAPGADLTSACQMKTLVGPQSALPPQLVKFGNRAQIRH